MAAGNLFAESTNAPVTAPPFPDAGVSLLRVTGALALVLGLFLGGAWLFKNWQRLAVQRGRQPKLNILETRSLGARQAVFVVGLRTSAFSGRHLARRREFVEPSAGGRSGRNGIRRKTGAPMSFGQALAQVSKKK